MGLPHGAARRLPQRARPWAAEGGVVQGHVVYPPMAHPGATKISTTRKALHFPCGKSRWSNSDVGCHGQAIKLARDVS